MSKLKIIVSCIAFFSAVAALMSWFCIAVLKADSSFLSHFVAYPAADGGIYCRQTAP